MKRLRPIAGSGKAKKNAKSLKITRRKLDVLALLLTVVVVGCLGLIPYFSHADTSLAYRPHPDWSFAWVGNGSADFTAAQLQTMATNYHVVVFDAGAAALNLTDLEHDGRVLKTLNPTMKVLFYFNSKHFLYPWQHPADFTGFNADTMALHLPPGQTCSFTDRFHDGQVHTLNTIPFKADDDKSPCGIAYYVDESAAAWHNYYLSTAGQIMSAGNFDGVAMDSFRPLSATSDQAAYQYLSQSQVNSWNAGQQQLLSQMKAAYPGKIMLYNGINPPTPAQPDRNLGPLGTADAILNEGFCYTRPKSTASYLPNDFNIMKTNAARGKIILQKTNYDKNAPPTVGVAQVGSFCFGSFMMGWQPGSSYFKFGTGYGIDELTSDPPESRLNLGNPTGDYTMSGQIGHRNFQNGQVYVNFGSSAANVTLDGQLTKFANGAESASLSSGNQASIGSQQALFLLNTSLVHPVITTSKPAAPGTSNPTSGSGASGNSAAGGSTANPASSNPKIDNTAGTNSTDGSGKEGALHVGWDYLTNQASGKLQTKPVKIYIAAVIALAFAVALFFGLRYGLHRWANVHRPVKKGKSNVIHG